MPLPDDNSRAMIVAKEFHEVYERLAPNFGYKIHESPLPWEDLPQKSKELIVAVVSELLYHNVIRTVTP